MLEAYMHCGIIEAGCDEAGRGCLAGPVFAAAVILPQDFINDELNDSKKLTEKKRYFLREVIEKSAVSWGVGIVEADEIDRINILNASFLAMHRAILKLNVLPEHLLIDGNRFRRIKDIPINKLQDYTGEMKRFENYPEIKATWVIKGDGKYMSIAAASILAKTYKDDYMYALHEKDPRFNWAKNKGYPTKDHTDALRKYGQTEYHRKSFHLQSDQLALDF
jgi:ribonuclease HII